MGAFVSKSKVAKWVHLKTKRFKMNAHLFEIQKFQNGGIRLKIKSQWVHLFQNQKFQNGCICLKIKSFKLGALV